MEPKISLSKQENINSNKNNSLLSRELQEEDLFISPQDLENNFNLNNYNNINMNNSEISNLGKKIMNMVKKLFYENKIYYCQLIIRL